MTTSKSQLVSFQSPVRSKSLIQIATSFGGFVATCALMYATLDLSVWLAFLLAPLAAGFVVRIFIIQHDCGHHSFFGSRRANEWVGRACSLVTATPFANWRRQHARHHATWNNLDARPAGIDMYSSCLTLQEYTQLSRFERLRYRILYHPAVALLILPPVIFLLLYRIPIDTPREWRVERYSVHMTNLALAALILGLGATLGFRAVLLVQLPIMLIAATVGVWLFSVQHRFEGTLWARKTDWRAVSAALQGSSYLRLPLILQWFTGNIGFHHIHHLSSKVPNYRLQECHKTLPEARGVREMTIRQAFRGARVALWDEEDGRMIGFREARQRVVLPAAAESGPPMLRGRR